MTARKKQAPTSTTGPKQLSVTKRTLKNLSPSRTDPKGGFIMKDTIIVRPTW
jgi:hypothetical protein